MTAEELYDGSWFLERLRYELSNIFLLLWDLLLPVSYCSYLTLLYYCIYRYRPFICPLELLLRLLCLAGYSLSDDSIKVIWFFIVFKWEVFVLLFLLVDYRAVCCVEWWVFILSKLSFLVKLCEESAWVSGKFSRCLSVFIYLEFNLL